MPTPKPRTKPCSTYPKDHLPAGRPKGQSNPKKAGQPAKAKPPAQRHPQAAPPATHPQTFLSPDLRDLNPGQIRPSAS